MKISVTSAARAVAFLFTVIAGVANAQNLPFPTKWEPVLSCDQDAVTVFVNDFERRMIQLKINNQEVSQWLWEAGRRSSESSRLTARFDGIQGMAVEPGTLNQPLGGLLQIFGQVANGVFQVSDFTGFETRGYSGLGSMNSGTSLSVSTARTPSAGLLVQLKRERSSYSFCDGRFDYTGGRCVGNELFIEPEVAGEWHFRSCHEL
jgi:hypothetical protein